MGRGVGKKVDNVLNIQNWPPSGRAGLSLGEHRGHWSAISAKAHHRPESLIIENHIEHIVHVPTMKISLVAKSLGLIVLNSDMGPFFCSLVDCVQCTLPPVYTIQPMFQSLWHHCLHILIMTEWEHGDGNLTMLMMWHISNEALGNISSFDYFIFIFFLNQ